jgi:peptidoglycan/LPS O-acetylase OafA/YrhL
MPDVFSLTPFIKDWDYHLFDLLLLTHGCFFAIGGLLWHLYVRRGSSLWWGAVGGLALTGIVQISAFTSIKVASGAALLVPDAAWLIALALIIASVHFNETAWRLLGPHSRLIGVIGLTTYPLYLLHKEIGTAIVQELWHVGVSRWTALGTGILFVLVLSFAVTLFFEPKLQAWVRAVLATWAARAPRLVLPQNEVGTSGS